MILCASFIATKAIAEQNVDGLLIEYPSSFILDMEKSESLIAGLPVEFQPAIKSLYIYDAPGREGIHEASITKITYGPRITPSLDGGAQGIISRITKMDGVKNVRHTIQPIRLSGRNARRVSITADRWTGMIGVEALVAESSKVNTVTQIQLIFGAKKSITLFGVLTSQREYAQKVLDSIILLD